MKPNNSYSLFVSHHSISLKNHTFFIHDSLNRINLSYWQFVFKSSIFLTIASEIMSKSGFDLFCLVTLDDTVKGLKQGPGTGSLPATISWNWKKSKNCNNLSLTFFKLSSHQKLCLLCLKNLNLRLQWIEKFYHLHTSTFSPRKNKNNLSARCVTWTFNTTTWIYFDQL